MERVQTISEMRDNIDRLSHVIGTGSLFTAEDALALNRVLEKLSWHRNLSIRYELSSKRSVHELAELWGLSAQRIIEIGALPLNEQQFHEIKVLDYPNLLNPESAFGDKEKVAKTFSEIRQFTREHSVTEEKRHDFRCMWSIGDPVSGYEFSCKHPGPEAMASGAVESWTPKQLEEHLNALEQVRNPMIASGATTGRVSCATPNRNVRPAKTKTPVSLYNIAKTVGTEFKKLRVAAGINQTEAGKLIGESQMYVSMLERGKIPSKKTDAPGMQLSLQEFQSVLKTLNPTTE